MEKTQVEQETAIPNESYSKLFLRFLRFGLLAWGGPIAQIAMIRQELVDEERWISSDRFNRVLAVYQVLPGPEAHELCVYFGMLACGRIGAVLAGLGFMLPGFFLMLGLSWLYVTFGINSPLLQGVFWGFQVAVAALIVRAIHRIGSHALTDFYLWGIALLSAIAFLFQIHFLLILAVAGLAYALMKGGLPPLRIGAAVFFPLSLSTFTLGTAPTLPILFMYGLRSGLLTFGGAYTVIPFLQHDAVVSGAWMTNEQFLDGIAISSILPAPLIIFSTFVGYLGGGPLGAIALTIGIFLPAFLFTLIGHDFFERMVGEKLIHAFLDGVTAGVVGLIAATTLGILRTAITNLPAVLLFLVALVILFKWKAKAAIALVVLISGLIGVLIY